MRIQPARPAIDENEPFKHALFDRKNFGESLTALLRNVEDSLVIFVNAPWGEGKTTFAEMWRAHLRSQKLDVIYFDAYAADYIEDPFVCFSGEILQLIDKHRTEIEGIDAPKREFKKTAVEVGKRLAGLAAKIALRAATMNAVDATHLSALKEIGDDVATGVSEIGSEIIEKKIENYVAEKDALKAFRESLTKLAKKFREEQGFPLTIIVDELDRCRPDFALNLLERIKHLFDVDGLAFVLLVNREQIESYVRTVYGEKVDARGYLLKFANLFVDLPSKQSPFRHQSDRQEFAKKLFQHYGFHERVEDSRSFCASVSVLIMHFKLTLREIEKSAVVMAVYYSTLPKGEFTEEFLVAMLATIKVKDPSLYRRLRDQSIKAAEFFEETHLDRFEKEPSDSLSQEWVTDFLSFCLLSDADYEKLAAEMTQQNGARPSGPMRMTSLLLRYGFSRHKIIPFLCSRLDQFSSAQS